ncbi:MAG: RnfABCDGE type electron transport complex subunit D [Desulfobacteraceae bacterium]|jgi:electron transport complex protein RnfD|nr:RnfABCDGE type electron transport complex subunit D [Desulfobacteraceae bacterium]
MLDQKKLIVSHAPFWHNGTRVTNRSYHTILAALPALIAGIYYYGIPVFGVASLSVATAIFWELAINHVTKRPVTIGDGNAALIGLIFAMLMPATMPWWAVITGTFIAVVIGKQIFGGIGANPFNPVALAVAIMMISWKDLFDFDGMLLNYDFGFAAVYPLAIAKSFGPESLKSIHLGDLLMGRQIGGLGATFGLGLILGGCYLMLRGFIRPEISVTFLAGVYLTALLFNLVDPARFAEPGIHLLSGYTLVGAFFLATEDGSSPVNVIPMLIYGAVGGIMTVLIRNIGAYIDGVILAILLINLISPLLDRIRPQALGKVV